MVVIVWRATCLVVTHLSIRILYLSISTCANTLCINRYISTYGQPALIFVRTVQTGDATNYSINVSSVCPLRTKLCKSGRFLGPGIRLKCNFIAQDWIQCEYLVGRAPYVTFEAAVKDAFPCATSTFVHVILTIARCVTLNCTFVMDMEASNG